jgi:hypothetical protein
MTILLIEFVVIVPESFWNKEFKNVLMFKNHCDSASKSVKNVG